MNQKANWVDYKELKQKVSLKDILDRYGLLSHLTEKKEELIGLCPFHKESKPSFHVSPTKNAFQCFGCKAKGNILDFVQRKESVDLHKAALLIQEWFAIGNEANASLNANNSPTEEVKKPELAKEKGAKTLVNPPLTFTLKVDLNHSYLKERGLAKETIEHFGLGYCAKGLMKDRIAIPIHNEKGELVAYAGRCVGEPPEGEGKYKFPPNFQKHLVLYNLHQAAKVDQANGLIIVEGFFDCFMLWQAGFKKAVALMGSTLSPEQEELLVASAKKAALMLDRDEAGRNATPEILSRLAKRIFAREVDLPAEGDQPDKVEKETLIRLLKDV